MNCITPNDGLNSLKMADCNRPVAIRAKAKVKRKDPEHAPVSKMEISAKWKSRVDHDKHNDNDYEDEEFSLVDPEDFAEMQQP